MTSETLMSDYSAPLRDVRFVLEHIVPLRDLTALPAFAHADADLVDGLLEEAGRFAATAVAPTNRDGDTIGAQLVDGEVRTPDSFRAAYAKYSASETEIRSPTTVKGTE